MDELAECCQIMLQLLNRLKDEGKITQEEYVQHTKVKLDFLEKSGIQ